MKHSIPESKATKHKRLKVKTLMTRSENMSRIRSKNTQPELKLRRALWAAGVRYRLHDKLLPGSPDLVFPSRHSVIFVHGCFWHGHKECSNFRFPKTRSEWWAAKLTRNKERDAEVQAKLESSGWHVMVVWECEVENQERIASLIKHLKMQNFK